MGFSRVGGERGGLTGVKERLEALKKTTVKAGVPKKTNSREGGIGNAGILYIHEFGIGVPERSVLRSTIIENQSKYKEIIQNNITPSIMANRMSVLDAYARLGIVVTNDIKLKFVNGTFTPLNEKTIKRKGSSKPLIDTGELRSSIDYEVTDA